VPLSSATKSLFSPAITLQQEFFLPVHVWHLLVCNRIATGCLPASASTPRSQGRSQEAISHTQCSFFVIPLYSEGQFGCICSLLYCQNAQHQGMDQTAWSRPPVHFAEASLAKNDQLTSILLCKPGAKQAFFWGGTGQVEQGDVSTDTVWLYRKVSV